MDMGIPSTSDLLNQQWKEQQEDYPLHLIVSRMMFVYGDSDEPLNICQEFMLDLLYKQLKMLLDKAHKLSIERHSPSVGFPEFMFAFRRHPLLIRKLIGYMRLVDLMPAMFREEEQKIDDSEDILPLSSSSSLNIQNSLDDLMKLKNTSKVIAAVRLIDVMDHLLADIDEQSLNATKMERMRRMELRTRQMEAEVYERFAEARRTSFCNWTGRRTAKSAAKFLQWVEAPPVAEGVADALNFCATEILAIITESAVFCRDEENHRTMEKRTDDRTSKALSIRHYEEAVQRNRGYAKRKDILFGHW
ncbi:hypothetical protein niasHS_002162 [Heterodera schachtii]|uniref:Uncharacterized protein n=1 Tax=Heterodera schachtii TaxID=97005 RepID=A0ABD2KMF7_HETSC